MSGVWTRDSSSTKSWALAWLYRQHSWSGRVWWWLRAPNRPLLSFYRAPWSRLFIGAIYCFSQITNKKTFVSAKSLFSRYISLHHIWACFKRNIHFRWRDETYQSCIEWSSYTRKKTELSNSWPRETTIQWTIEVSTHPVSTGWQRKTLLDVPEDSYPTWV